MKKVNIFFNVRGASDVSISVLLPLDRVDAMSLPDDQIRDRAITRLKELNMHFLVELPTKPAVNDLV